ncbi:MAG: hypothetical protein AAFY46_11360 [Planctomycetota bacterium]
MRSLGRFVGEIGKAVKGDPAAPKAVEVSRTTETETRDTADGTVTLRRTTIEEVELPAEHRDRDAP